MVVEIVSEGLDMGDVLRSSLRSKVTREEDFLGQQKLMARMKEGRNTKRDITNLAAPRVLQIWNVV
jgi:hypothetical protein